MAKRPNRLAQLLEQVRILKQLAEAAKLAGRPTGIVADHRMERRRALLDRAHQLRQESLSWKEIAKTLGYTDRQLRNIRREAGKAEGISADSRPSAKRNNQLEANSPNG